MTKLDVATMKRLPAA